jgi:hypothetical protein
VVAATLAVGSFAIRTDAGAITGPTPDACALMSVPDVSLAVGASGSDLAGPLVERPGTCSWHSTQASCTLRSLSIVVTHGRAAERLDALRAGNAQLVADADDAADALYVNDVLPEGTAVFIAHLDLRVADTLAEITLVGRVGPDASHDILRRVGEGVRARLAAPVRA